MGIKFTISPQKYAITKFDIKYDHPPPPFFIPSSSAFRTPINGLFIEYKILFFHNVVTAKSFSPHLDSNISSRASVIATNPLQFTTCTAQSPWQRSSTIRITQVEVYHSPCSNGSSAPITSLQVCPPLHLP